MSNQKRDNDEIEEIANNELNTILTELHRVNNLKLIKHETGRREIGLDFFYEIVNRSNNEQQFLYYNQSKGTDSSVLPLKSNPTKISYQIDLRHAKYWYEECQQSFVFTLCDINNKKVYWYCIQNDNTIPQRILEQEQAGINSLQIYIPIENVLNKKNFNQFYNDLNEAKNNQIIKQYGSIIELKSDNYLYINNNNQSDDIIDQLYYVIELFENFQTLPTSIIEKLYPFKENKDSNVYVNEFTLHTDNENIFDLIDGIALNDTNYSFINGKKIEERQQEKLNSIIKFFNKNLIMVLAWSGKKRKERNHILLASLFKTSTCNCERCTFNTLNFQKTAELLDKTHNGYPVDEILRKGYTAFLMGDIKKSANIFLQIYENYKKSNPIAYTSAKYNLIQLKKIGGNVFYNDQELLELLDDINYNVDQLFISKEAPHFSDIYKSIKDYSFFQNSEKEVDKILFKISRIAYQDKIGGWTTANHLSALKSIFFRIYYFIENNLLIFNFYNDYRVFTTKILECFIALHAIKNSQANSYKFFSIEIIKMWLFHVDYDAAKFLLDKHNIKWIKVENIDEMYLFLDKSINNLYQSLSTIESIKTGYFTSKVERILNNIVLVCSKLELKKDQLNDILAKLLSFSKKTSKRRFRLLGQLCSLFYSKKEISLSNTKALINQIAQHNYKSSHFSYLIRYFVDRSDNQEIEKFVFELLEVKKFDRTLLKEENKTLTYFRDLWYAYTFLSPELQNQLRELITSELQIKFESDLFYSASIYGIIEFDLVLFEKFKESIPNLSNSDYSNFYKEQNIRLVQVINLCFKYNLDLKSVRKYSNYASKIHKGYFDWLMNLDGFDYANFDPYWIIGHHSKYYIKAFKKSPILLSEVKKSLENEFIMGVADVYLNQLTD